MSHSDPDAGARSEGAAATDDVVADGPVLALFDVDNTLMRGASLYYFAAEAFRQKIVGPKDLAVFAWQQMRFLAVGENKAHMQDVEERALGLLSGHTVAELQAMAERVVDDKILPRLWPETVAIAREHVAKGHQVWLVTATPKVVGDVIAERLGFTGALGTVVEAADGIYTGELIGKVLHGEEKVGAVAALAEEIGAELGDSWAYSDSRHDIPLLNMVGHRMAINPDKGLERYAIARGWPTMTLDRASIKEAAKRVREEAKQSPEA